MSDPSPPKGRGAGHNPPNRFESIRAEPDWEQLEFDDAAERRAASPATVVLPDRGRSIITENDSPDVPFRFSLNPYRGCEHGCSYCYARPGHEYLGMSAGLDFETKIVVKHDAAALLAQDLAKPSWRGEPITLSGVTDCYQPLERKLRVTRGLLEVLWEHRQAVTIVTKNALVLRDLDLLAPMAERNLTRVFLSLTTLDAELGRALEPRTSTPEARLRALRALRAAGVPVGVLTAPVIPGLNDEELPALLAAAGQAGAATAGYVLLRLPHAVAPLFEAWLEAHRPELKERVLSRLASARGGKRNDPRFGTRMVGEGPYAETLRNTFSVFCRKHGLDASFPPLDTSQFRRPREPGGQMRLFD